MWGSSGLRTVTCPLVSSTCSSFICQPHIMAEQSWRSPTFSIWVFCREQGLLPPLLVLREGLIIAVRHTGASSEPCNIHSVMSMRNWWPAKGGGVMGMNMKSVGREGDTVWLWLCEVVRAVPSRVLRILCQNPQQMPVLPGNTGMAIPLLTFSIPYGTRHRRE